LAGQLRPFTRCMGCNGRLRPIGAHEAARSVPPRVLLVQRRFTRCEDCGRVYWPGTHQAKLEHVVARARAARRPASTGAR